MNGSGLKNRAGARRNSGLAVGLAVLMMAAVTFSSAAGASGSSGLSKAKAVVAQYEKPPAAIGSTKPLPKTPPKGKTLIFLNNENPQTVTVNNAVESAAKALGWNFKSINWNIADPSSLVAAMRQALVFHPIAVSFSGVPEAAWQTEVAPYQAAGVGIIPCCAGTLSNSPAIFGSVDNPSDGALQGKILASWFIAKSRGKGQLLLANIPDIPSLAEQGAAVTKTVAQDCPNCSMTTLAISLAQFGTDGGVSNIVSELQKNPGIKYVITEQGGSDQGLPAALAAAGITGIQFAGTGPGNVAFSYVKNGTASAMENGGYGILGWMIADIAAQKSVGVKAPTAGHWPVQLITKSFLDKLGTIPADINYPSNYQAQYKKKWHVG